MSVKRRVAVALLHHPVLDKLGSVVATNVTNYDIHDIARACRVYGVEKYYIVHPALDQHIFVSRILEHWRLGFGAKYNPMRRTALGMVEVAKSLEEACGLFSDNVQKIATSAKEGESLLKFSELRELEGDIILIFGTGYGLHPKVLEDCDHILEPIRGASPYDYRHLSVRSAVSICLDRWLA